MSDWESTEWLTPSPLTNRDSLAELLEDCGLCRWGVEIGTHRAEYARTLLRRWPGQRLFCVDPWQDDLPGYADEQIHGSRQQDYALAVSRLRPFGRRAQILRTTSAEAATGFARWSLDFAYIDGNHAYEYVLEDLELWSERVRPGGLVAWHDIINGAILGVRRAVWEFTQANGIAPVYSIPGAAYSFYFFAKP